MGLLCYVPLSLAAVFLLGYTIGRVLAQRKLLVQHDEEWHTDNYQPFNPTDLDEIRRQAP